MYAICKHNALLSALKTNWAKLRLILHSLHLWWYLRNKPEHHFQKRPEEDIQYQMFFCKIFRILSRVEYYENLLFYTEQNPRNLTILTYFKFVEDFRVVRLIFLQKLVTAHSSDIRISDKILWTSAGMVRFYLKFYTEFKYGRVE